MNCMKEKNHCSCLTLLKVALILFLLLHDTDMWREGIGVSMCVVVIQRNVCVCACVVKCFLFSSLHIS